MSERLLGKVCTITGTGGSIGREAALIAHRVRRKHQRLPPSLLIENASDPVSLRCQSVLPEAFPIKPSDNWRVDTMGRLGNRAGSPFHGSFTCSALPSSSERQT